MSWIYYIPFAIVCAICGGMYLIGAIRPYEGDAGDVEYDPEYIE